MHQATSINLIAKWEFLHNHTEAGRVPYTIHIQYYLLFAVKTGIKPQKIPEKEIYQGAARFNVGNDKWDLSFQFQWWQLIKPYFFFIFFFFGICFWSFIPVCEVLPHKLNRAEWGFLGMVKILFLPDISWLNNGFLCVIQHSVAYTVNSIILYNICVLKKCQWSTSSAYLTKHFSVHSGVAS